MVMFTIVKDIGRRKADGRHYLSWPCSPIVKHCQIVTPFEILIGAFAGYCGCYFISMKLVKKTPEQVLQLYFERLEKKLTQKP